MGLKSAAFGGVCGAAGFLGGESVAGAAEGFCFCGNVRTEEFCPVSLVGALLGVLLEGRRVSASAPPVGVVGCAAA